MKYPVEIKSKAERIPNLVFTLLTFLVSIFTSSLSSIFSCCNETITYSCIEIIVSLLIS